MNALIAQTLIISLLNLIILIFMVVSFIYRFSRIDNKLNEIRGKHGK